MIRRIGIVRERGISLRIRISNALNVCGGKAERLTTDGRCVREWDAVLSNAGLTGDDVGVFVHDDDKWSAETVKRWGVIYLGIFEQLLRGMSGARLRRVGHEANITWKSGGCRRGSRPKEGLK
jgi:hypothetical protein